MSLAATEIDVAEAKNSDLNATLDTAVSARRDWLVYGSSVLYAGVFAAASTLSYLRYLEPRLDLGNMVQTIWSTAHGNILQMSDPSGATMSRLAVHADPFLALLVPFWWIWPSPVVLLVLQAMAVASGALPVYWLAKKHLGPGRSAIAMSFAYLLYPCTQFNAFTPIGIHAVSFGVPLLLFAIWFLDEGRLVPFSAFAVAAGTTKEEIGAAIGGLGVWYLVQRRKRAGAVIAALGFAWSVVNLELIIPRFAPSGASPFAGRYEAVGGTPTGMVQTIGTDPTAFVHQVATWHKLFYLVLVFAPFLGLWALEPLMLVGALPDVAINLLSSKPEQTTVSYQYTAGIIPFVVAASILGAARLRRRRPKPSALLVVVITFAVLSPLVPSVAALHGQSEREIAATRAALKVIPQSVPVSASETLGAYVSNRRSVATFPIISRADWVLVGPLATGETRPDAFRRKLDRLRKSERWRTVFSSAGVWVFHRRA
jgi:uncharacterized membrane protein